MPKVSVITGAYNINEKYAKKAIDSILAQTFSDFEYIICDDGSDNDTWDILTVIANSDNRIKLIRNDRNMGLAYTLNHCLEYASGEYVARMDMDDIFLPVIYSRELDILKIRICKTVTEWI